MLWAGSDDGLVHLTRDGGSSWQDVTPPELPEWAFIRNVEPSPHDAGTCYVAATRYKLDDTAPYIYRTRDYGKTWRAIVGTGDTAIPAHDFVRVVRADPNCPGVLYAGTETGLCVSLDDGASWRCWRSNFPVVPVYDLKVEGDELAIATHGRSFWILDDLTPLRRIAARAAAAEPSDSVDDAVFLFPPRPAWRLLPGVMDFITGTDGKDYTIGLGKAATYVSARNEAGQVERRFLDAGEAAPIGAVVYYYLPEYLAEDEPSGDSISVAAEAPARDEAPASLAFHDERGNLIREFHPKPAGYDKLSDEDKALDSGPWMPLCPGINRFVWDLRYSAAARLRGNKTGEEAFRGPLVLPGTYRVRLRAGHQKLISRPRPGRSTGAHGPRNRLEEQPHVESSVEVVNDPRSPASLDDLREQLECLLAIRDKLSLLYARVKRIRDTGEELERWCGRLEGGGHAEAAQAARALRDALAEVESALILPGDQADSVGLHHRVRLNAALASVIGVVDAADARPTAAARALAAEYMAAIDAEFSRLDTLLTRDLGDFNRMVSEANLPPVAEGWAGWPRAVTHPRLPQFRTCPTKASGSSNDGLAAQRYTLCTTRVWGKG